MNVKRTKHTQEFRREVIKLITQHGYSQAEASRRLGIKAKNLNRWIRESQEGTLGSRMNTPITSDHMELQQLRKENQRLKMEHDILKKAAAFFANESR